MASGQLPFNRVAAPQFNYVEEITSNIDEDSEWLLRDRGMRGFLRWESIGELVVRQLFNIVSVGEHFLYDH